MKKLRFVLVGLLMTAASICSYGQELTSKKGPNNKFGFVDKSGKEVIPFKYDEAHRFFGGELASVKLNSKWGFVDKTGKEVIPFKYDDAEIFREGLAAVKLNGKWGFVDFSGKEVIPFKYNGADRFSEGLANVSINYKWGYIDKSGKEVIPFKYNYAGNFKEGLAIVRLDDKEGLIDKTGKEVIPPVKYNRVGDITEGLRFVKLNDKWGFVDNTGKEVIPLKYDEMIAFMKRGGVVGAFVSQSGKWGRIDVNDNWLIPPQFEGFAPFAPELELAVAKQNGKWGIISESTGKWSMEPKYDEIRYDRKKGFYPVKLNNKWGAINAKGEVVLTTTFNTQEEVSNELNNRFSFFAKNHVETKINEWQKKDRFETTADWQQRVSETARKAKIDEFTKEAATEFIAAKSKDVKLSLNIGDYDATLNDIRGELDWLSKVADAFKGEANIIFYYAGHGVPDENSLSAWLLPVDGWGANVNTGYKLDDLYKILGKMPAKTVTVFMDACFSGSQRSGDMMASARGIAVKATPGAPTGSMVVFSAAQGDETAFPYREKGHGMFTYFLLKKLQETKGDVTLGELSNYIETNVRQQSIVTNNKSQTPTVTPAAAISDKWKGMKLR